MTPQQQKALEWFAIPWRSRGTPWPKPATRLVLENRGWTTGPFITDALTDTGRDALEAEQTLQKANAST